MEITVVLAMVWLHWLGDFLFQNDDMATKKGSEFKWLTLHVGVYCIPLVYFSWQFAVVNFVIHWMIDAVTSRIGGRLQKEGKVGMFFKVLGFDQALHMTTLYGAYFLMFC